MGILQKQNAMLFAVSKNDMPAKYFIGKCIPSNLDLPSATEVELWSENSLLTETCLNMWEKVRVGEVSSLPSKLESPSLVDLSVDLTKRMLSHCNFCRWDFKVDRSNGIKHGTCQLESTSKIGS
jgi:putative pyruvate formate lyase activating enzyme